MSNNYLRTNYRYANGVPITAETWNKLIDEVDSLRREVETLKNEKMQLIESNEKLNSRVKGMVDRLES